MYVVLASNRDFTYSIPAVITLIHNTEIVVEKSTWKSTRKCIWPNFKNRSLVVDWVVSCAANVDFSTFLLTDCNDCR